MKWINTKDKLPEMIHVSHDDEKITPDEYYSDPVLGYFPCDDPEGCCVLVVLIKDYKGDIHWDVADFSGEYFDIEDITHWMPLEAPNNDKEGKNDTV